MLSEKTRCVVQLVVICLSHLMVDFMLGIWAVFKVIGEIDLVMAGLMAGIGGFIGEGSQLFFGVLGDRGYRRQLMAVGIGLVATAPFLVYLNSYGSLFVFLLSVYVGSGAFHPSASSLLIHERPSRKSILIALFACSGMLGAGISQFVFIKFYYAFHGHTWMLVVPVVVLLLVWWMFHKMPSQSPSAEASSKQTLQQTWQALWPYRFELGVLYLIALCLQIVVFSFSFLLSEILYVKGAEEWLCLGGGYFYFILGAMFTVLPIGYGIDKWGYKSILGGIIVISTVTLYIFLRLTSLTTLPMIGLLLILGGTMGVIAPVSLAGANTLIPTQANGLLNGLFMGGVSCVAGFGPIIASVVTAYGSGLPVVTLQLLSSLLFVALGLMYFLPSSSRALSVPDRVYKRRMECSLTNP